MVSAVAGNRVDTRPSWVLLVAGVFWLLVALALLSFDSTSVTTLGYLVGFVLILAGLDEMLTITVTAGWRWVRIALGLLFILGGVASLLDPFQTVGLLSVLFGWYLLIKGFFGIAAVLVFRGQLPMWGLALAVSVIELVVGFWALGYPGRSASLLLLWVGVGALLRGIGDVVVFAMRGH